MASTVAPVPGVAAAPPMYVADPLYGGEFAAIPVLAGRRPRAGLAALVRRCQRAGDDPHAARRGGDDAAARGHRSSRRATRRATWPGGVDLHLGRWFGMRQQHAVELIYWGVYGIGSTGQTAASPPAIDAIPQAPGVTVGGTPAATFLTDAAAQQISRSDLVNDVEINWVYSLWDRPEFLPPRADR